MSKPAISPTQRKALDLIVKAVTDAAKNGEAWFIKPYQVSRATMYALRTKGLIDSQVFGELRSSYPATGSYGRYLGYYKSRTETDIRWQLTEAGRAILATHGVEI